MPVFDSTQASPLFTDDNDLLTTAEAISSNPCAPVQNDQSFTEGGTNLFSREDGLECLPPVNIGAETLHLFETPLNSLENIVLPKKGETSDDSPPLFGYPGLLPDGEEGIYNSEDLNELGREPYMGPVRYEAPESNNCPGLTDILGTYNIEVCCDGLYVGYEAQTDETRRILAHIDEDTVENQEYAVVYNCLCTLGEELLTVVSEIPFNSVDANFVFIR